MAEETKVIRIIVDSSKAVDGSAAATQALAKLERSAASMDGALSRMEKGLASVGGMVKAQLALMVAELGARFLQMGRDSLKAVAGLDDLAEQLGITTVGLQALQFSAVQNGVKLEQLETGISKFSQKMGEAANGSKDMVEALTELGVKNLDVQGKLRPTEALLQEVAAAITRMEDPARRSAAAVDFFGKAGARMLPMLADIAAGSDVMAQKAAAAGAMIDQSVIKQLKVLDDQSEVAGLKFRALIATIGAPIATDAMEAVNAILGKLLGNLKDLESQRLRSEQGALPDADMNMLKQRAEYWNGRAAKERNNARTQTMAERATQALNNATAAAGGVENGAERAAIVRDQYAAQLLVSGTFAPTEPLAAPGASTSTIKGAGQGEADKIAKLLRDNGRELEAANAYAAASERGARAVADLEIHFKALKSAQDAYGATADKNAGQVAALTKKIEEQMQAAERLKSLKDFNLGTEELERTNTLLEAENALINASVETRARELALIRLKNEVQSKGLDENNPKEKEAIDRRHSAIEQNERLKAQGDELKKANELWTAPLKSALESIQSTAADAFATMLESGKFSFAALGDVVKKTVIRMIAEFAALAVIRPIMGSMIGGLQGLGLVSGSTASSLGYGSSAGGAAGGGFSMPFMGGGGAGMFDFLNQPIFGASDASIGAMSMADPFAQGAMQASGSGALGGLTWGGGLAGAVGIGMGAYQMATSKSTAGKIGGGLGMLGSGIGMASAMGMLPMLGAAGGPIGMGIAMAGMLLPSILGGGEEYQWDPLAGANVQFNPTAGGYTSNATQQLGGKSIGGQFAGVGQTLDSFFGRAGGITDASKAFGAAVWNNQREGTTSTYLISPTQGSNQQTRDESGDPAKAVDRLIAKVFYDSIQNNAAMKASPTLRTAFSNREPNSTAAISALLDLIDTYDQLGKVTNTAEAGLKAINDQFAGLTAGANEWGLSLKPIIDEQKKLTTRFAQDFVDNLIDPMAVSLRAFEDEKKDILASLDYIKANTDVHVDMARANEALLRKEAALKEQLYGGAVAQLEEAIKRLSPGGALSNLDPSVTLAGMKASYRATYAQAAGGDAGAIGRLAGEGSDLAGYGKSYFAGSPEYNALRDEILANLRAIQTAVQGPVSSGGAPLNVNAVASNNAQFQQLMAVVESQSRDNAQLRADLTRVTALLSRYLMNEAA